MAHPHGERGGFHPEYNQFVGDLLDELGERAADGNWDPSRAADELQRLANRLGQRIDPNTPLP